MRRPPQGAARAARLLLAGALLVAPAATGALLVACVATFALVVASAATAADEAEVLRLRGQQLATAGRCAQAVPVLEQAAAAEPSAPLFQLIGGCQIRLGRWAQAEASLARARALDPSLPDLDLQTGIARFHQDDVDGAERSLAAARRSGSDSAELSLYEGLIHLERSRELQAGAALERARRLDAGAVEPIASYYAGIAWMRANQERRAREALERVEREAPNTAWSDAAGRALARALGTRGLRDRRDVRGIQQAERPLGSTASEDPLERWIVLSAGMEYDDNVALRGSGVDRAEEISDDHDWRGVWTLEFGGELLQDPDWTFGALGAYYGSGHVDLEEFNVNYPTVSLWVDRIIGNTSTARFQYDLGYAWVDSDPYLFHHTLTPAFFQQWGEAGTTRVFAELTFNNFLFNPTDVQDGPPGGTAGSPCPPDASSNVCGPFGLNEKSARNRDGIFLLSGFDHIFAVDRVNTEFRGGYRFQLYDARGSEYSYRGHELRLGSRSLLPWRVSLDFQASFTYRPYRNPSTFPDPDDLFFQRQYPLANVKRRERLWQFDVIVERPITRWLTGSVRYGFYNNNSNRDVYDYDRHVVGTYLTVRFDP